MWYISIFSFMFFYYIFTFSIQENPTHNLYFRISLSRGYYLYMLLNINNIYVL